jgi:hypothetical protein
MRCLRFWFVFSYLKCSDVILSMSFKSFLFDSANSFLFELDAIAIVVSYRFCSFLLCFVSINVRLFLLRFLVLSLCLMF